MLPMSDVKVCKGTIAQLHPTGRKGLQVMCLHEGDHLADVGIHPLVEGKIFKFVYNHIYSLFLLFAFS